MLTARKRMGAATNGALFDAARGLHWGRRALAVAAGQPLPGCSRLGHLLLGLFALNIDFQEQPRAEDASFSSGATLMYLTPSSSVVS